MSPAKMRSRAKKRRVRSTPGPTRARILEAFSTKAKLMGIRAVMMAELASELRMSAATLYKEFPSKEHLAMACVNRWAHDLAASEAAKRDPKKPLGHFDQFMHWVDVWAASNAALSPVFRRDLETDYPAVWKRYREVVDERKRLGAALLRPLLKPELNKDVALSILDLIFTAVLRPEFADRLRISRHEAIHTAVSIWAAGALDRSAKLRILRRSDDA